ncbi:butyrate kinase [Oceanobacillus rekensis]|uniref:butyrate kinase n=1 Tax=Oceanobacillus rekensis TaxID=937927 RepID=UPI000B451ED1|nr:butyrate kinase [Oceanobacillus rekensis]
MQAVYRTLIINPGSDSTQIGVFDDERCIFENILHYQLEQTEHDSRVIDQSEYRKKQILERLDYEGINLSKLTAVCGKGGLLRPIKGGTYKVNRTMLYDLRTAMYGKHVSNLGAIIAYDIAEGLNIDAYIVDPVVVDELEDIARYSGIPEISRRSIFHALNHKAAARKAATTLQATYEKLNLIIIHMGRGITIGAHHLGRVIDVNNGLDGDGPFTTERSGGLPIGDVVRLCFSGQYSEEELLKKVIGNGGLMAYLNQTDVNEVESQMKLDDITKRKVYDAMAYQISKEIGSMGAVLSGDVDAIVFTGFLAYETELVEMVSKRVDWIADIMLFPGENELIALNEGVLRVLRNEEEVLYYPADEE